MVSERMHEPDDPAYLRGCEAGRKWGRNIAQPAELECLQRLFERVSLDPALSWDRYFFSEDSLPYTRAQRLAVEILGVDPDEVDVPDETKAFWNEVVQAGAQGLSLEDPVYLQGFADGALEIWDERIDRL